MLLTVLSALESSVADAVDRVHRVSVAAWLGILIRDFVFVGTTRNNGP